MLLSTVSAVMLAGCSGDLHGGGGGGLGSLFAPKGEPWTIQCIVLRGPNRRQTAESVAKVLCSTADINRREVRLEHGVGESTIYYGKYNRRIESRTRRLEVTDQMNRDMLMIKELGVPGQGHYFPNARFVPIPTPDVGNPSWSLDRADGVYSLRVAIFCNEPGFYERKKAAAEYAAFLRKKGYAAFYHHGHIHSEVFVGEFGEGAVQSVSAKTQDGDIAVVGIELFSPEVHSLRAKETFTFELWNLRKRGRKIGNKTVYNSSQLVRITELLEPDEW
ncbi:MAG: hypothetical protein KAV82_00085 [Phycisphaerae bacterium]|nr:hypothetical protein [Phycisphaerae bacterium]